MEEDEDPVVEEIPVFLSQALAKQLYLFQYPTRPAIAEPAETNVVNARIKPNNCQVAVEIGIDTYSDKYSQSKGEQIALNTDGPQSTLASDVKSTYFKTSVMDKVLYESTPPNVKVDKYAIAVIQDGEMHCTPLKGMVQLRPSHSYLDKQDRQIKESQNNNADEDQDDDLKLEPDATLITVKFADENQRNKQQKEKSYSFQMQQSNDEAWIESAWWQANSDKAEMERMKLYASPNMGGCVLSLPVDQYVSTLVTPTIDVDISSGTSRPTSVKSLANLTLVDQIKEILTDAKILPFPILMQTLHKAGCTANASEVVRVIGNVGVLVRGLWAARGELLYPENSVSVSGGVPAATMCRTRDYVLYLLTQSLSLDRRRIAAVVKLPTEEILEILRSVATYDKKIGWRLKYAPDEEFEAHYPEVVQRQNIVWEARQRQYIEMLNAANAAVKRQRKKSQRESISSDAGLFSPKPRSNSVSSATGTPLRDVFNSDSDSEFKRLNKNKGTGKRTRNSSLGHDSVL